MNTKRTKQYLQQVVQQYKNLAKRFEENKNLPHGAVEALISPYGFRGDTFPAGFFVGVFASSITEFCTLQYTDDEVNDIRILMLCFAATILETDGDNVEGDTE